MGQKEGAVTSIPGNEGRIAQAWVNVRGGMSICAAYFWHTEGWTPRNEAILEAVLTRARATKHLWLVACDANMSPADFENSLWFRKDQMHAIAPELQRAGRKVPRENGLRRLVTMSLLAIA